MNQAERISMLVNVYNEYGQIFEKQGFVLVAPVKDLESIVMVRMQPTKDITVKIAIEEGMIAQVDINLLWKATWVLQPTGKGIGHTGLFSGQIDVGRSVSSTNEFNTILSTILNRWK